MSTVLVSSSHFLTQTRGPAPSYAYRETSQGDLDVEAEPSRYICQHLCLGIQGGAYFSRQERIVRICCGCNGVTVDPEDDCDGDGRHFLPGFVLRPSTYPFYRHANTEHVPLKANRGYGNPGTNARRTDKFLGCLRIQAAPQQPVRKWMPLAACKKVFTVSSFPLSSCRWLHED